MKEVVQQHKSCTGVPVDGQSEDQKWRVSVTIMEEIFFEKEVQYVRVETNTSNQKEWKQGTASGT